MTSIAAKFIDSFPAGFTPAVTDFLGRLPSASLLLARRPLDLRQTLTALRACPGDRLVYIGEFEVRTGDGVEDLLVAHWFEHERLEVVHPKGDFAVSIWHREITQPGDADRYRRELIGEAAHAGRSTT